MTPHALCEWSAPMQGPREIGCAASAQCHPWHESSKWSAQRQQAQPLDLPPDQPAHTRIIKQHRHSLHIPPGIPLEAHNLPLCPIHQTMKSHAVSARRDSSPNTQLDRLCQPSTIINVVWKHGMRDGTVVCGPIIKQLLASHLLPHLPPAVANVIH